MERRQIPGFYYDESRNKYFKITADHLATSSDVYTRSFVEKTAEDKKRSEHEARRKRARLQLVTRSKVLKNPFAAEAGLLREIHVSARIDCVHTWGKACARGFRKEYDFVYPRRSPSRRAPQVDCIEYDTATDNLIMAFTDRRRHWLTDYYIQSGPKVNRVRPSPDDGRTDSLFPSQLSSLTLTRDRMLVATTIGDAMPPSIYLCRLKEQNTTDATQRLTDHDVWEQLQSPMLGTTVWTSRANPERAEFAIGSSRGFGIGTVETSGLHFVQTQSDAQSLDWLNAHVLAVGHRNGAVKLYDTRSKGKVSRLRLPGPVTSLRGTGNETKLVACWNQGSMDMYDLRTASLPVKRKPPTEPVLEFDSEDPVSGRDQIDIKAELGLVVAAKTDGIDIYSLRNGERLRRLVVPTQSSPEDDPATINPATVNSAIGVKLIEDKRGCVRLLASRDNAIADFRW
ncbi:hypothetical protein EJ06DRAFT_533322 [Trichodelitschia bisporula]|uniref:WD40 repeat-like protein n=1 Tax=Trichodelitschia bisporula TaxID=703511 RepID=A0A6G1HMQ5_9PEZI|nr:hypothetical protein EJ06DRAFT_533322 [Trichodelitschia bisporula]